MRVDLHPAYVLHQRDYRETSLLIEVFSSLYGRVTLVAKGARRQQSRIGGSLHAFRPLKIAWSRRGEMGTLTAAEAEGPSWRLFGRKLISAFYLNEVIMRLLPQDDPHPGLFQSYQEVLSTVAQTASEEPALRIFEKRLLDELGYGLVLDHDVESGAKIDCARAYYYQNGKGPCLTRPASGLAVKVHGHTLIGLANAQLDKVESLRESKRLMRFVFKPLLGQRPLYSRQLFTEQR